MRYVYSKCFLNFLYCIHVSKFAFLFFLCVRLFIHFVCMKLCICKPIRSVICQFYLPVLVVTNFVLIFPFLRAAVRAVSLVCPVPLFFSLRYAVWFVIEQIKIESICW